MYERFTDRARKVMRLANQEAQRFNHEYIGTEHILLGLVKEGSGVAAQVLTNLGVDLRKIRLEVEKIVQAGPDMVTMTKLPKTPRAKKVIEYAVDEARNLNHNYVGSEHLLLGLIREDEGVASQVLMNLGLDFEKVREGVLSLLGHSLRSDTAVFKKDSEPSSPDVPDPVRAALEPLDAEIDRLTADKEQAVEKGDFERAAILRDDVDKLKKKRQLLLHREPTKVVWEYEVLLPIQDQSGNALSADVLAAVKKRLHERFDAFLASRLGVDDAAQAAKAVFRGDTFRLLCGAKEEPRRFFLQLKAELARDFSLAVAVVERSIELL